MQSSPQDFKATFSDAIIISSQKKRNELQFTDMLFSRVIAGHFKFDIPFSFVSNFKSLKSNLHILNDNISHLCLALCYENSDQILIYGNSDILKKQSNYHSVYFLVDYLSIFNQDQLH
jgi:hypothetical protein